MFVSGLLLRFWGWLGRGRFDEVLMLGWAGRFFNKTLLCISLLLGAVTVGVGVAIWLNG